MLIVYRTNPGFEGQIQKLEQSMRAVEMDEYLKTEVGSKANLAYIDVGELKDDDLKDLIVNRDSYTVDPKTKVLRKGGRDAEIVPEIPLKERIAALEARAITAEPVEEVKP